MCALSEVSAGKFWARVGSLDKLENTAGPRNYEI